MAFMMPVVKKNYNIYGSPEGTGGFPDPNSRSRKSSQASSISTGSNGGGSTRRKKACSESSSLCTSPRHKGGDVIHRIPIPLNNNNPHLVKGPPGSAPVPIGMLRGRASAPILVRRGSNTTASSSRKNSLPQSLPSGKILVKQSSSLTDSVSDSSLEDQNENLEIGNNKFHVKLLNRLKKSLRIKGDQHPHPVPAAS